MSYPNQCLYGVDPVKLIFIFFLTSTNHLNVGLSTREKKLPNLSSTHTQILNRLPLRTILLPSKKYLPIHELAEQYNKK